MKIKHYDIPLQKLRINKYLSAFFILIPQYFITTI
jgi:hypothetical protein